MLVHMMGGNPNLFLSVGPEGFWNVCVLFVSPTMHLLFYTWCCAFPSWAYLTVGDGRATYFLAHSDNPWQNIHVKDQEKKLFPIFTYTPMCSHLCIRKLDNGLSEGRDGNSITEQTQKPVAWPKVGAWPPSASFFPKFPTWWAFSQCAKAGL